MNNPPAIPPFLTRALRRQPSLLAGAVGALNFMGRLPRTRSAIVGLSIAALAAAIVLSVAARGQAAWAVRLLLERGELFALGWAIYTAALVVRRRREVAAAASRSWLVATPAATRGRAATGALLVAASLLWQLLAALALALLLCVDAAVTLEQAMRLAAWAAAGAGLGALLGTALPRAPDAERNPASRYTRRPRAERGVTPSAAPLSGWPAAQALAWSRPENARWLVLVAILSVPTGAGAIGGVSILATWLGASYLVATLAALPRVAREAAAWLRSTPLDFWAFAWPMARSALWQQAAGAVVAAIVMVAAGASPLDALELGCLWLALVVLVAAVSLADCYRGQSPLAKIWLSALSALLAEQRVRGLGVALALAVTAWHLRPGATNERA
ncbi:MAG TPA: hypothetical protein VE907_04055 [Gammaproteobacteria bacterium]|nr:hypothetical protein [Gammaproteobacteria bacterium]